MNEIYNIVGISKQAAHQHYRRRVQEACQTKELLERADQIRKEHPKVGCRKMALDISSKGWGRDKIEQLLLNNGYRVYYKPNYTKTTQSQHQMYYPNLIEGLELKQINRVVQTDITYYRVEACFYYLVFLIDVYSRRIVGHAVSKTLEAAGNIKALRSMINTRKQDSLQDLIHHSDKGSQYIDKEYVKMLQQQGIQISMCTAAWENAYAERINKTIKEEYLDGWEIKDFATLSRRVKQAVRHYNSKRRHQNLGGMTPIAFEKQLKNLPPHKRTKMKLYMPLQSCAQKKVYSKKKKEPKKKNCNSSIINH